MSMPGPFMIDPDLYDDAELGSEIRAAHARGASLVVLVPFYCSTCFKSVRARDTCPACGDEAA